MTHLLDIIIPTLGRPDRLAPLVANIHHATINTSHRVVIVVEAHDTETITACAGLDADMIVNRRTANYQGAVNTAYEDTTSEFLFCGADDLLFQNEWDAMCGTHMDDQFDVYGTNDLYNPHVMSGMHSTHSLVRRSYLDTFGGVVDVGPGSFLPECYDHNFCDTEFIATAKMRCKFRPCLDAVVEHLHPVAGKAEWDDTYARSMAEFDRDARLYDMRTSLWSGIVR